MADRLIGIEIGGTKLQIVRSASPPRIDSRYRATVDRRRGAEGIMAAIETGINDLCGDHSPSAIGVGFGGPIDPRTGRIVCSHQIEGWDNFSLGDWLNARWSVPFLADNDANTAALAEALHGAGQGFDPVFYITLGSGVGGGLVRSGHVYHGHVPGESEIGHLRLDRRGLIVEESCSGWAVDRKVSEAIAADPGGGLSLARQQLGGPPAAALGHALTQSDPIARDILEHTSDDLAFALSHVVHLQHPETMILGGGLSLLGEPLLEAVQSKLPQYVMRAMHPPPKLQLASLHEAAVPIGALALAEQAAARAMSP